MIIYLIRHAQTIENELGLLQGHTHVHFTPAGLASLPKLKKAITAINFDICYSSDLPRCVETARAVIGKKFEQIIFTRLLREKNNGKMVGKNAKSINWNELSGTFETRKLPEGESLIDVQNRAREFLKILSSLDGVKGVLVFGHGAFLKILVGLIDGLDLRQSILDLNIDHCSLTIIRIEDKIVEVIETNNTSHLNN